MGECKCCNDLGSSPKYQLFVTISIALFLIPLGVYGISIINNNDTNLVKCGDPYPTGYLDEPNVQSVECLKARRDFYRTSESVAYYAGFFVNIICMVTCIGRCCAPCCCQLSDVPRPCPCTSFGMLDLCFYIGSVVAIYTVNLYFSINEDLFLNEDCAWHFLCRFAYDNRQFAHVVLCLGILMLCVAVPLGCIKFKRMQEKSGESTSPQQAPQVVGNAVAVKEVERV